MLKDEGLHVSRDRFLGLNDHDNMSQKTIDLILHTAKQKSSDSIIMTEKDAVKIDCSSINLPCYAVTLRIAIDEMAGFWECVIKRSGIEKILEHRNQNSEGSLN
jgi:tetraacyldisaccharide-1-P 4'-kinase